MRSSMVDLDEIYRRRTTASIREGAHLLYSGMQFCDRSEKLSVDSRLSS